MKLKEAQMLGVLALIAAGIIVLTTWGGDEPKSDASAGGEETARLTPDRQDVNDLDELLKLIEERSKLKEEPAGDVAVVEIVGSGADAPPEQVEEAIEDAIIDTELEKIEEPKDIPVKPVAEGLQPESKPAPEPPKRWHTVRKGERLIGISRQYYQTGAYWKAILEANKHILSDPRKLRPGMKILIPPKPGQRLSQSTGKDRAGVQLSAARSPGDARVYVVKKNDTLYGIARELYGSGLGWRKLLSANADQLDRPEDLRDGMTLIVP